jgi:hypothetical protein
VNYFVQSENVKPITIIMMNLKLSGSVISFIVLLTLRFGTNRKRRQGIEDECENRIVVYEYKSPCKVKVNYSVKELRKLASLQKVKNYTKLNKVELMKLLKHV